MSEDEIERVQRFESEDEQRAAALRFAREVVESRGHPSDESLEEAREAGYTDEQIIEMVATVVLSTFTNYMNDTIQTEVDFPVREPIQSR
jgi:alkylhydroperoxidase family enzyme